VSFVSEMLKPSDEWLDSPALSRGEPALPRAFRWREDDLVVTAVIGTWRSTTTDRGDTYLARHWYELALADGRIGVVYFDRKARGGQARWWLYTITEGDDVPERESFPSPPPRKDPR
jgi:hypothetical protein